jgi:hypothetical protein
MRLPRPRPSELPELALSPRLVAGGNRLRDVFLDPAEQAMFPQQERAAAALVAGFRESVGTDVDDPRFTELVGELSLASPLFRELWARHDVGVLPGSVSVQLDHPQVGMLELNREKLLVSGADRVMLVIYHPDAGSDTAENFGCCRLSCSPTCAASDFSLRHISRRWLLSGRAGP